MALVCFQSMCEFAQRISGIRAFLPSRAFVCRQVGLVSIGTSKRQRKSAAYANPCTRTEGAPVHFPLPDG